MTQVSEDEVRKSLTNLIKYGLLETSGKDYMLTARVYEAVKSDIEYTRDKTLSQIEINIMGYIVTVYNLYNIYEVMIIEIFIIYE